MKPLLAFIHIEKAAGTSFRGYVKNILGENLFWHNTDGRLEALLATKGEKGIEGYSAIGGHFSFPDVKSRIKSRNVYYSCILRDPKVRVLSLHSYIVRQTNHPLHSLIDHSSVLNSLKTCAPFLKMASNWQCFRISGVPDYESVLEVLGKERFVIGKVEDLGGYLGILGSAFGLFGVPFKKSNVGVGGYSEQLDDLELSSFLSEITSDDQRLYDSFDSTIITRACSDVMDSVSDINVALPSLSDQLTSGLSDSAKFDFDATVRKLGTVGLVRQTLVPTANLLGIQGGVRCVDDGARKGDASRQSEVLALRAEALHLRGMLALKSGNLDNAVKQLEAAVSMRPRYLPSRLELTRVLLKRGDVDTALDHLRFARQHHPAPHSALDRLCEQYVNQL